MSDVERTQQIRARAAAVAQGEEFAALRARVDLSAYPYEPQALLDFSNQMLEENERLREQLRLAHEALRHYASEWSWSASYHPHYKAGVWQATRWDYRLQGDPAEVARAALSGTVPMPPDLEPVNYTDQELAELADTVPLAQPQEEA